MPMQAQAIAQSLEPLLLARQETMNLTQSTHGEKAEVQAKVANLFRKYRRSFEIYDHEQDAYAFGNMDPLLRNKGRPNYVESRPGTLTWSMTWAGYMEVADATSGPDHAKPASRTESGCGCFSVFWGGHAQKCWFHHWFRPFSGPNLFANHGNGGPFLSGISGSTPWRKPPCTCCC